MTGRNNRPDKDGKASNPARLDQFGDQQAHTANIPPKDAACDPDKR